MKNAVCAELLPVIDTMNLKIMHKLKIVILAFAVFGSGMLIALLCSNKADESSWASPLQGLGSLTDAFSATEEPAVSRGDDLEHFLEGLIFNELQYGAAAPTRRTQQKPTPNACLSGLEGGDLANVSDQERAAQLKRVKEPLASNALKATPPPTGNFKPKRTRSLPTASAARTRQAAHGPQGLIASEWAAENASSAVRSVNFENYNPSPRVSESKTHIAHQEFDLAAEADCVEPHAEVFRESKLPSANKCATCHEQINQE